MNIRLPVALLSLGLILGCGSDTALDPLGPEPQLGVVAGQSGCYTVVVESHGLGVFPAFSANITGDLVGTTNVLFDPANLRFDGITIKNGGVVTWNIEGGIVPELVGKTFRTSTTPMNIVTSNGNKIVGRIRAMDGFPAKANLTFDGTFNAENTPPPFAVDLVYRGVICP
jgi:hypothetical protein